MRTASDALAISLLFALLGGACAAGCRGTTVPPDSGRRRDAGPPPADVWAPEGVDAHILPSEADSGLINVRACLDESRCVEFIDYTTEMRDEAEMGCTPPSTWHTEPCDAITDVELAGGCLVDFGGPQQITWFRAPEFTADDAELICMTAGGTFVPAR